MCHFSCSSWLEDVLFSDVAPATTERFPTNIIPPHVRSRGSGRLGSDLIRVGSASSRLTLTPSASYQSRNNIPSDKTFDHSNRKSKVLPFPLTPSDFHFPPAISPVQPTGMVTSAEVRSITRPNMSTGLTRRKTALKQAIQSGTTHVRSASDSGIISVTKVGKGCGLKVKGMLARKGSLLRGQENQEEVLSVSGPWAIQVSFLNSPS